MNTKRYIIVCTFLILLLIPSWQKISFSQEISRPVTYSAEFKPLGDGIDWEGQLPDDFDDLHLLFKFKLNPGTFEAEINADINFDQDNQTLGVQPRHVTDLSNVYVGKFQYSGGVLLSGEIVFDFVLPIPFFPDIPISGAVAIPGFPQIDVGWDESTYFDSLLLKEDDTVEVSVGIRKLLSTDITAVEIAELLAIALTQGTLPQRIAKIAGEIIQEYVGDGGIRVNGGILNHFTLDAMGIYVDGQLITDDEQTVSATGLNPSSASHSIQSSFEEKFSTSLDLILTSDVFFNFEPFGIELWSYEKEIVEVPIPILPETELNSLDFVSTPDIITFPVETEQVPIANNAPEPVGTISQHTVRIGDANTKIDLSDKFADPDGDTLTFSVATSNPSVLTTQRVGNELTLIPWSAGSATITITATDLHGLTATQTFTVTVLPTAPTSVNRAPTAIGTIAEQTVYVGGFSRTIDVSSYFSDPDGDTLTFNASSDNLNIVSVEVRGNSNIRITPGANGSTTVTVIASDGEFTATQTFSVIVSTRIIITTNRAPLTQGTINTQSMTVGDASTNIDVSGYFHDPDGDSLTYSVASNNANVVTTQRTGTSSIRLTPVGDGDATVSVTASDGSLSATLTFSVTVDPSDIDISESSDVVVENISADYVINYPGERYTVSVTVRNAGSRSAPNIRLRYYLSDDDTFSSDDVEYENLSDFVGGLRSGDSSHESVNLDAPSEEGEYYIIARTDPVDNEQTSRNNYQAIKITVLPPAAPDLVVSLISNRYTVDPNQRLILDATVRNQGAEDSRQETTVRFYSSTDANISADDVEIGSDSIRTIRDGRSDRGSHYPRASEQPGTYYFYARVDPLNEERITDNNDSNVITITVRGPDLVIASVYADYYSIANNEVDPISPFSIYATVRNEGTDRSRSTELRYYLSTDAILSSDDPEVGVRGISRLNIGESDDVRVHGIQSLSTSGFFYLFVCVETDDNDVEISTDNNCSAPIKITVINRPPRAEGTIAPLMLDDGKPLNLNVSTYFTDRNNDTLTFNAQSSDDNIATAVAVGAQLTITPKRAGNATITVTAQDSEFTATQTFVVSVTASTVTEETWMPDVNLRTAVRTALRLTTDQPLTQQSMEGLTRLTAEGFKIKNLTGLAHAPHLQFLYVRLNEISDITPLKDLRELRELILFGNEISDITPLAELESLESLDLSANEISDITPLENLTSLRELGLAGNEISDITPLAGLTQLSGLLLGVDPESAPTGSLPVGIAKLGNNISDLTPLENLTNLRIISINCNPISDLSPLYRLQAKTSHTVIIIKDDPIIPDGTPDSIDQPEEEWMPDANLRAVVRSTLGLRGNEFLTQQTMQQLTKLTASNKSIENITGLEHATNLTNLDLFANYAISDISPLKGLTALEILDLSFNNSIRDITPLKGLISLKSLNLGAHTGPGDDGSEIRDITPLAGLTGLTNLNLYATSIRDVMPLSGLTNLTNLNLGLNQIRDITPLSRLTNLMVLELRLNQISDVSPLEGLTSLRTLNLFRNPITDFAPLRRLQAKTSQLIDIDVDISKDSDVPDVSNEPDAPEFTDELEAEWMPDANLRAKVREALGLQTGQALIQQAMRGLTTLRASNSAIGDISGLEHATLLTELDVAKNFQISDITPLTDLIELTKLSLQHNRIGDITPVGNLTSLTTLNLTGNQINDITALSGLSELVTLSITHNQISNLDPLKDLTVLRSLHLSTNQISDISAVSGLTSLTVLSLGGNSISDISALSGLTSLTWLSLGGNSISDISALSGLTSLTWLSLDGNSINDISALSGLTSLTVLTLSDNYISDISAVSGLTSLGVLNLSDNSISDISAVSGLTSLTELFLSDNSISDISAVSRLTSLKRLMLNNNDLSDISKLEELTSLRQLNLSGNPISDYAPLRRLVAAIKADGIRLHLDITIPPAAPASSHPTQTSLLPNYPNPFNPETWIPFQLAKPADVTLTIYNVRGVVVRELALGYRTAGVYYTQTRAAHWDGKNNLGEKVSTGVYFVKFKAGDYTRIRKMLIKK